MPIHAAVIKGDIPSIHNAIKLNPNCIFELNDNDFTPLHLAAKKGNYEIIELLCETTISQNILDYLMWETIGGTTAIEFALNNGHFASIKLMLKYRPEISHKNKDGLTILHKLIMLIAKERIEKEQAYQMMELFLMSGINPLQTDNGMDTYLNYLKMYKLPVDYWRLLFLYGGGIGFDFSTLNLDLAEEHDLELHNLNLADEINLALPNPDLSETINLEWLRNATAGQLICGSWLGQKITKDTPGFENAITHSKQLTDLLEKGVDVKYKHLLNVINIYLVSGVALGNPRVVDPELTEIAKVLVAFSFPSLKKIVAKQIKFFYDNDKITDKPVKKLTQKQMTDLISLPAELQNYLIDATGLDIPRPQNLGPPSKKSP